MQVAEATVAASICFSEHLSELAQGIVSLFASGPFMLVTGTVNDWGRPIDDSSFAGMFPLVCTLPEPAKSVVKVVAHVAGLGLDELAFCDKAPIFQRCERDKGLYKAGATRVCNREAALQNEVLSHRGYHVERLMSSSHGRGRHHRDCLHPSPHGES